LQINSDRFAFVIIDLQKPLSGQATVGSIAALAMVALIFYNLLPTGKRTTHEPKGDKLTGKANDYSLPQDIAPRINIAARRPAFAAQLAAKK
jgi:hypothetical protein